MLQYLKDKWRVWSANHDLQSAFRALNKNAMEYGHGITMFHEGPFSIALYTSNPDVLTGIRGLIELLVKEQEEE